jgi:hypothetical protein
MAAPVSFDEPLNTALTRAVEDIRGRLEAEWRSFALDLVRRADAEREAQLAQARREAQAQLTDLTRLLEATSAERDTSRSELESLRGQIDALRMQLAATQRDLEATQRELEATQGDLEATQGVFEATRRGLATRTAHLADAVATIDSAQTLGDVLDVLAASVAREVDRVAVLVRRDHRLVGWRLSGFAKLTTSPRSLSLSFDEAGMAGTVVRTGIAISRAADTDDGDQRSAVPSFARDVDDRHAAAFPVVVGGDVVAVLYADAPAATSSSDGWFTILDVLSRHASRVLESLTVQRAVGGLV